MESCTRDTPESNLSFKEYMKQAQSAHPGVLKLRMLESAWKFHYVAVTTAVYVLKGLWL